MKKRRQTMMNIDIEFYEGGRDVLVILQVLVAQQKDIKINMKRLQNM